jgi:alpha-tubulin suppressor-like RCC1 family protein
MSRRSVVGLKTALGALATIVVLIGAACAPGRIVSIGAGTDFTCVLHDTGEVRCWGRNDVGQLGRGTSDTLAHPEEARVALSERAVALSVGREHACALTKEGDAFCWGDDRMAESGAKDSAERCSDFGMSAPCRTRPARVASDQRFRSIAAGFRQSCGITIEQRVFCWGDVFAMDEERDTLGLDRCGPRGYVAWCRRLPAMVPVFTSTQGGKPYLALFDTLAIGAFASCGIAQGYTYCWGHGVRLQWMPGTESSVFGTGIRQTSVGEQHACGIGYDTVTVCWGTPRLGALGRADLNTPPPRGYQGKPFRPIDGNFRFIALSVGDLHSCAIEAVTNRMLCWGANQYGQLGIGSADRVTQQRDSATAHSPPTPVIGGLRFIQVASGLDHTCAVATDGDVYCWGRALRGSLGNALHSSATPARALGR